MREPRPMGHCLSCLGSPSASAPLKERPDPDRTEPEGGDARVHVHVHALANAHAQARPRPRPRPNVAEEAGERRRSARIGQLFDAYRDPDEASILSEGIERLCADLQLRPDEFRVLLLAWKLDAEQMCRFTEAEFVGGLKAMRVDSLKGIQAKLPEIASELQKDPELFKDLYRFTFKFGLDAPGGQRILPADVAVALWRLVFTAREPPVLERWLTYLERHPHVRGIPKDTWYMFLNFCDAVDADLSGYDDTEAWPSLFDDFVEFENDRTNQNISKNQTYKKSD